jgi:[acyl-carrier-protein] S-malonyltransferase
VVVANVNDPRQVVLSGSLRALAAAGEDLQRAGVRAKLLPIVGAFHSPAMARAVEPFRAALERIELAPTRAPVLRGATATPFTDPRAEVASALVSPVRWLDVMRALYDRGVRRFLEPGPGRVLTGLVRRSLHGVEAHSVDELEAVRV